MNLPSEYFRLRNCITLSISLFLSDWRRSCLWHSHHSTADSFQPKPFYDSMILHSLCSLTSLKAHLVVLLSTAFSFNGRCQFLHLPFLDRQEEEQSVKSAHSHFPSWAHPPFSFTFCLFFFFFFLIFNRQIRSFFPGLKILFIWSQLHMSGV